MDRDIKEKELAFKHHQDGGQVYGGLVFWKNQWSTAIPKKLQHKALHTFFGDLFSGELFFGERFLGRDPRKNCPSLTVPMQSMHHAQNQMRLARQETLAQLEQDADREIEELKEMHLDPAQMQVDPQLTRYGRNIKEPNRIFMIIYTWIFGIIRYWQLHFRPFLTVSCRTESYIKCMTHHQGPCHQV